MTSDDQITLTVPAPLDVPAELAPATPHRYGGEHEAPTLPFDTSLGTLTADIATGGVRPGEGDELRLHVRLEGELSINGVRVEVIEHKRLSPDASFDAERLGVRRADRSALQQLKADRVSDSARTKLAAELTRVFAGWVASVPRAVLTEAERVSYYNWAVFQRAKTLRDYDRLMQVVANYTEDAREANTRTAECLRELSRLSAGAAGASMETA